MSLCTNLLQGVRFAPLALVFLLTACSDSRDESVEMPGAAPDYGSLLGVEVQNLAEAENPWSSNVTPEWAGSFTSSNVDFGSLEFHTAQFEDEDEDEWMDVRLISVSLAPRFEGGKLALAMDTGGEIQMAVLWGHPDFDEDTDAGWENFYRQFAYGRSATAASDVLSDEERDDHVQARTSSTESSATEVIAWLKHVRAMVNTNWLIRRSFAASQTGTAAPAAFYEGAQAFFSEMANDYTPMVAAYAGDAAAQKYRENAMDAAEAMSPVIALASENDAGGVRNRIGSFRRNACRGCHSVETTGMGEDVGLRSGLTAKFTDLGMRKDLFFVGYDLWAIPGAEGDNQYVADVARVLTVAAAEKTW